LNLAPGSTFGPYKILEPLGRGGMASVFKAYEPALDRYVALKVLPAESVLDEASAERFRREAKVIARLEHPNITPIHGFGIDERTNVPWMAMRLINGGTLSSRLTMRITPPRVVGILRGVADALDYAHAKGVMHRDVKPANILLDEAGRVYLADFGIARLVEGATALTAAGLISGTPSYMAPEQATGVNVDHRVDVYALGVVAYEALAGRVPFAGENPIDVLMKHVQAPVPDAPDLPPAVMDVLRRAMAKKADDRWQSAGEFITALEAAVGAMPERAAPITDPALLAVTAPGAGPTAVPRRTSAAATGADIPTRVAATRVSAATAVDGAGPWRPGLLIVMAGVLGVIALVLGLGLYVFLGRGKPVADGAAAVAPPPPAAPASLPPATRPPASLPPESVSASAPPGLPPPTLRPAPVTTRPAPAMAAAPPVTSAPTTVAPAPATRSLRLDVSASQPSFGAQSAAMEIDVSVDGRPMKTYTLRFDGTTPFARSRRRQVYEVPGVPVGRRTVAVLARADGVTPIEARTEATIGDDPATLTVDVRLRGNGEGDARFR
jgi:tRNA A-37 threonylcarbamoyl transferase component Bud32